MSEKGTKSGYLFKRRNKFPRTWQKRYFSIVTDDGSTLLKYWATEEASSEEGTEVGTADLSTICNIEIVDGVLNFEAFQPNKERNKDWALKGDAELIEEWCAVLSEYKS